MAINQVSGFLKYKDANGDMNLLMPITTKDMVEGIDDIETQLGYAVMVTEQTLTDEQKAQARTNIGVGTFIDRTTGLKYTLYVDNGKLQMEEVTD